MTGRSVLAIGAHPDDIELGCGATLLAHVAAGDRVTMLVLTGGENGPGVAARRDEQVAAAATIGANLRWGGMQDCALTPDAATVSLIEAVLAEIDADVVYVHAPEDSHQDHRPLRQPPSAAGRRHPRLLHYPEPVHSGLQSHRLRRRHGPPLRQAGRPARAPSQVQHSAMVDPEAMWRPRGTGAPGAHRLRRGFRATRLVSTWHPSGAVVGSAQALRRSPSRLPDTRRRPGEHVGRGDRPRQRARRPRPRTVGGPTAGEPFWPATSSFSPRRSLRSGRTSPWASSRACSTSSSPSTSSGTWPSPSPPPAGRGPTCSPPTSASTASPRRSPSSWAARTRSSSSTAWSPRCWRWTTRRTG